MGKIFEGFKVLCIDFDQILEKKGGNYSRGDIIQGRILIKEIRYVNEIKIHHQKFLHPIVGHQPTDHVIRHYCIVGAMQL